MVVNLWVRAGQEANFEAYEAKAAFIMGRYGGKVERAIRVRDSAGPDSETPFEVHVLRFDTAADYQAYRADGQLKALAAERAAAIEKMSVFIGTT